MGMFDEVRVPCPKCHEIVLFQTKSGDCTLTQYDLADAPIEVMGGINRHPGHCPECGTWFKVQVQMIAQSVEMNPVDAIEDDFKLGFSWDRSERRNDGE